MSEEEANKVLEELNEVRPEKLNKEAKRLFEAIMKIADERDKAEADLYEANCRINDLLEINKELKNENKILKDKRIKIIADSFHKKMAKKFNEDFIPKSKIKAKIEEVKDGTFDAKIVLQSLLEKE